MDVAQGEDKKERTKETMNRNRHVDEDYTYEE